MPKLEGASSERLLDHFANYLFDHFQRNRHVRRVAPWLGLIALGIERVSGTAWKVPRERQLRFEHDGRSFKVKFNHRAGPRGGIDIIEILPGRGSMPGTTVVSITNLGEAEQFYRQAETMIQVRADSRPYCAQ